MGIGASWLMIGTPLKEAAAGDVSFKYPKSYLGQAKRASEGRAEQLVSLRNDNPLATIELNKEIAAAKPANILKMNFLDYLDRTAEQSLRYRYPGYKKLSLERTKASGRDLTLYKFTYLGQDKQTTLYVSFFIMPKNNDAYYLFLQAADEKRWQNDTKIIQSSLQLN